jgi:hypothetical protein
MSSKLQKIYSVFSPSPLRLDQQVLYVNLDDLRGDAGIVHGMAQKIRLSDQPTCQVLTGHRGSGKSTELVRLRQELEQTVEGEPGYFVVQVQADDELDRNDIDFPEVLIAIVRQMAAQLRKRADIKLKPGYFKRRLERLKDLAFSEVSFDKLDLETGMGTLSTTIKNSPEAREKIREALEPDTSNWLKAANDVIGEAVLELRKKGRRGLVVIVDDLDKMITRPHSTAGCSTTEYLFVHRSAQLTAFQCHLVYTLPIELAYSHHESNIRRLYSGLPVVPMTKVAMPPPNSKKSYPRGLQKFRDIIDARLREAGASEAELFQNNRVRDDLIQLTGGQPTELMTLIREAIVTNGLPIGAEGVKRCRNEMMRSYRRQLRDDHWPLIEEARRSGQIVHTKENEATFRELLDSRALLLYRNDEEWYGVNPAIENLESPAHQQESGGQRAAP